MPRKPQRSGGYAPIEDYAAIGDGRTVALVALDGAIDFLCLPAFDEPAVFAALLDPGRGGSFTLQPAVPFEAERRYVPETNVLETEFHTAEGRVRVTDALDVASSAPLPWRELARRVEGISGEVPLRWRVEPRFDYGAKAAEFVRRGDLLVGRCGKRALGVFAWDAGEVELERGAVHGSFTVRGGERALLAVTYVDDGPHACLRRDDVESRLDATVAHWRGCWERVRYDGPYADAVRRSALVLQLLADDVSGAIVAAGTMGLPEQVGGDRNYDYRYVWVRDATFALDALLDIGLNDIGHRAFAWLLRATHHTHPRLQPIYTLDGVPKLPDERLDLAGWRGSRPVLLGNGAAGQLQLGNFGDMIEAAWHYTRHGNALDAETGMRLAEVADFVCEIWRNDDSGIWELQDEQRAYTESKMGAWLALDRALRLAHEGQLPSRGSDRWRAEAEAIRGFVDERCWSRELDTYTAYAGTTRLDASVLLAVRMGFVEADDPRMLGTIAALDRELAEGPLVWRFTGMRDREASFLPCAFWLVEALARAGRVDEAQERMEALLRYGNDVGLYSEEALPDGTLLGNVPQALTHLSLINAARALR